MKTAEQKVSYRAHDWFDEANRSTKYGIQAKAVGYDCRWLHCAENSKPLIFDTQEKRDAKLKELRARQSLTQSAAQLEK